MSHNSNPRQLVMRRDTATGMTLIGWDEDIPVGRFEHIQLILESEFAVHPAPGNVEYQTYLDALEKARSANQKVIKQQRQSYLEKGWHLLSFDLEQTMDFSEPDVIGNYSAAAMKLCYSLTGNQKRVWAVLDQDKVIYVCSRSPKKQYDEFTYQVWYHKQLSDLEKMGGTVVEGELIISESGLWFNKIDNEGQER